MGHGVIPAGSEKFVESEWHDNPMPSLYNDDAIHAFRIQMSEELRVLDLAKVNNPVLKRLLDMGCFDWKTPNCYVRIRPDPDVPRGGTKRRVRRTAIDCPPQNACRKNED